MDDAALTEKNCLQEHPLATKAAAVVLGVFGVLALISILFTAPIVGASILIASAIIGAAALVSCVALLVFGHNSPQKTTVEKMKELEEDEKTKKMKEIQKTFDEYYQNFLEAAKKFTKNQVPTEHEALKNKCRDLDYDFLIFVHDHQNDLPGLDIQYRTFMETYKTLIDPILKQFADKPN